MIQTAYNGQTVFLINDAPNLAAGYDTEFSVSLDQQESLTKRESRRPYSATLQTTIKATIVLSGVALRVLQGQLRQLKAQPVLCPFWPAVSFWSLRALMSFTGGLLVAFKADWSNYAIYAPGSEPGWPNPNDLVMPLLYGFLKDNQPKWLSPELAEWPIEFTEDGPATYALIPSAVGFTTGPTPATYGSAPTIIPQLSDHNDLTESLSVGVTRTKIGFAREQTATFYPHDVYRGQTSRYTLNGASNISQFVAWFGGVSSQGASFWATSSFAAANLSASALSTDTSLSVSDVSAVQAGDYLAVILRGGSQIVYCQIGSIVGNVLNLPGAIGVGLAAGQPLYYLSLAKVTSPKLKLTWLSPVLATCKLDWTEVRPEEGIPAFETVGTTIGQLPRRAVLFQFIRDYGNGAVDNFYFTSFESDLAYSGKSYLHGPWSCGDIGTSLNLEADTCDIQTSLVQVDGTLYTASPLILDVMLNAEFPLEVIITFVDVANNLTVSNPVQVFQGDCTNFSRKGNSVTAHCKLGSAMFDTELPLFIKGVMCNHIKGSPGNGTHLVSQGCTGPDSVMIKSKWKFTALVTGPVSGAFPFSISYQTLTGVGASAATATLFLNWFAFGTVEWGAGNALQRRLIVGSTLPAAGIGSLTLHRFFSALPNVGDTLTIYPGCDGMFTTCQAYNAGTNLTGKFGNQLNFSGDPFMPIINPMLVGPSNLGVNGGKK